MKLPRFGAWLVLLVAVGCGGPKPEPVHVFAAVSTKEALEQCAAAFRGKTGVEVSLSFEASSVLAHQVEKGDAADLFLSADEEWADYLGEKGLVEKRRDLLGNRLVVVVPARSTVEVKTLKDLAGADVKRLAVANEAVPAGRYARAALQNAGVWEAVRGRLVEGGNVRATLTYVTRGEAEAGLVYATDAAAAGDTVRVALEVPADLHPPIRYPLALLKRSQAHPEAGRLYEFLGGPAAASAFRATGFQVLP